MIRPHAVASLCALVLSLSACGDRAAPMSEPDGPADEFWRLEENLRLGAAAGNRNASELFGSIGGVTTDSDGRIYVLDEMNQEIRVFGADGGFSHVVGSEGPGPGELTAARGLVMGRGDTLIGLDDGAMRYSVFAPDGSFVRSVRRDIIGWGSAVLPRALDDGRLLDWAPRSPDGRFGARLQYAPILSDPDLTRVDSFPPLEHKQAMVPSGRMVRLFHNGRVVAAADAGGNLWFAHSPEYRVYRRTLSGDTTLVIELEVRPAPVTDAEVERIRESSGLRPSLLEEHLEGVPDRRPIISRLRIVRRPD